MELPPALRLSFEDNPSDPLPQVPRHQYGLVITRALEVSSIAFEFISKPVDFDQLKERYASCLPQRIEQKCENNPRSVRGETQQHHRSLKRHLLALDRNEWLRIILSHQQLDAGPTGIARGAPGSEGSQRRVPQQG